MARIGFNAQRLAGQRLGVGRYIEYMIDHWARLLTAEDELTLYLRQPLSVVPSAPRGTLRTRLLESGMSGVPWENLRLRGAARRDDVLFCPAYTAPVGFRGATVVATHSVTEAEPGIESWAYRQTYSRLHGLCARQAAAVIVPGEITRRSVIDEYGVAPSRVVVIPQGADDCFAPGTPEPVLREVRTRFFGADRPFLLFVGKCSARRNIPGLIEAFAMAKAAHKLPHGLLIFGPNFLGLPLEELCKSFGVEGDVVQTDGKVGSHTELVPIYSAADIFIHPSQFEGWSMTTVEAMACGTPVIASRRGGMGEVTAGQAFEVDEPTPDALAHAIGRVLGDTELRLELQRQARSRGLELNWAAICRNTMQVVRNAATGMEPRMGIGIT